MFSKYFLKFRENQFLQINLLQQIFCENFCQEYNLSFAAFFLMILKKLLISLIKDFISAIQNFYGYLISRILELAVF